MQQAKATSKKLRKDYVVLIPFPWHQGHWTTKKQVLALLPQEAKGLLSCGRVKEAEAVAAVSTEKKGK